MKLVHPIIMPRVGILSRLMFSQNLRDEFRGVSPKRSREEQGLICAALNCSLALAGGSPLALLAARSLRSLATEASP